MELEASEIVALPQETASVRRSDVPVRVRTRDGRLFLVLLEVQSRWAAQVPLRLLKYDVRYRLQTGLSVLPVVMLLRPSAEVTECFEDGGLRYRFQVISLAAMDAQKVMEAGHPCLMPFVGLMRGGMAYFDRAEQIIYDSELERRDKADLLTGMALLTGLVSRDLPQKLLNRRKDIMRESVAYELIKKEGFDEGLQEGMHKGLREGMQKGLREGMQKGLREGMQKGLQEGVQKGLQEGIAQGLRQGVVQSSRRLLVDVLEERFEIVPRSVLRMIQEIDDPNILEMLHKAALRAESIQGFMEKVRAVVEL